LSRLDVAGEGGHPVVGEDVSEELPHDDGLVAAIGDVPVRMVPSSSNIAAAPWSPSSGKRELIKD
jgi:hypothetical protein